MSLENSVIYVAPNRAHHFQIARELKQAGMLHSFYCGASRLVARNRAPDPESHMVRVDFVQSIYVMMRRFAKNNAMVERLALLARKNLDLAASRTLPSAKVILGYSGAITHCLQHKNKNLCGIVEAVNTHVDHFDSVLEKEGRSLGVAHKKSPTDERDRRILEYSLADAITVPSEAAMTTYIPRGIDRSSLYLHWIRPSVRLLPHVVKRGDGPLGVLFVGQVTLRKGIKYIVDAARALSPQVNFRIVGQVSEDVGFKVSDLPVNVTLTGTLAGAALEKEYNDADLFLLPSLEEGMALVMFEAMNAGLPVIATYESGFGDLQGFGAQGHRIAAKNPAEIVCAIRAYLNDPDTKRSHGNINREVAQALAAKPPVGRGIDEVVTQIYNEKFHA